MAILGVAGIVYGAFMAFVQEDVKKLIAYSSVSHLGFCVLGLFALTEMGIEGSIYTMLSHGLTTSGLFLAVGVIYERRHTRRMSEFGGLWATMPVFGAMFLICVLGSAGLPALSGFVGEFLAIVGTFIAGREFGGNASTFAAAYPDFIWMPKLLAAIAATGVILGAVYLLTMFQKVMFGPITNDRNRGLPDLSVRELIVFLPVVVMIFVMGVFPRPFLNKMHASVDAFVTTYQSRLAEGDGPARIRGGLRSGDSTASADKPEPTPEPAQPPTGADQPPGGAADRGHP
jgi:NADH-quinone oxidoreductase subunit M